MPKKIIGTCEYDGKTFDVSAIPYGLFRKVLKEEASGDAERRADVTMEVVQECVRPSDGSDYSFDGCPWNDVVELSKLTMARAEGAGAAFTIKPAN